jgi:hypothetical protein
VEARRRVCVGSFDSVRKKERGRCERGGGNVWLQRVHVQGGSVDEDKVVSMRVGENYF